MIYLLFFILAPFVALTQDGDIHQQVLEDSLYGVSTNLVSISVERLEVPEKIEMIVREDLEARMKRHGYSNKGDQNNYDAMLNLSVSIIGFKDSDVIKKYYVTIHIERFVYLGKDKKATQRPFKYKVFSFLTPTPKEDVLVKAIGLFSEGVFTTLELVKAKKVVSDFNEKKMSSIQGVPQKTIDIIRSYFCDGYNGKYDEIDKNVFEKSINTILIGQNIRNAVTALGKPHEVDFLDNLIYRVEIQCKITGTKYHSLSIRHNSGKILGASIYNSKVNP